MMIENTATAERDFEMVQILIQAAAFVERAGPEVEVAASSLRGDIKGMLHDRVGGADRGR